MPRAMSTDPRTHDRFWSKVSGGDVDACWLWSSQLDRYGYGRFRIWQPEKEDWIAHRWAFRALIADLPDELVLDHLCRTRACVNPWHLEPVTRRENQDRGHHVRRNRPIQECKRGHPFTPENTHIDHKGYPTCRPCLNAYQRGYRQRKAAAASLQK